VSRILRRNPALVSVTGGHKYWNGADEMQNVMAPILPRSLRLRGREELDRFRSHGGWTYACDELFQDFRETADDVSEKDAEQFKHAVRRVISLYGSVSRKHRFVDKSQSYSLKVSYIEEILKDSNPYFIFITRNPYALCQRAIMKTNLSKIDREKKIKVDMAVQHWGNTVKSIIEDSKEVENFNLFKIEDILKFKDKEIKKICKFLDLDFNGKMMPSKDDKMPISGLRDNKWYPMRKNINGKYLDEITDDVMYSLNSKYGILIDKLKYDKIER